MNNRWKVIAANMALGAKRARDWVAFQYWTDMLYELEQIPR